MVPSRTHSREGAGPVTAFVIAAFLVTAILTTGCGPATTPDSTPEPTPKSQEGTICQQETVDALSALYRAQKLPEHLMESEAVKTGEEFDVNEIFDVLSHLSMEPGYVLDYVYCYDSISGWPVLYARPQDQPAHPTCSSLLAQPDSDGGDEGEAESDPWRAYLNRVEGDGSAEGFFELAVLDVMGGQFYLYWHAGYNDAQVLCDRAALEGIVAAHEEGGYRLAFTLEQRKAALALDVEPKIEFGTDTVTVRVVTFSEWGGFEERIYTVERAAPNRFVGEERTDLVDYNCGIMF
jgi:hypothetical protein